MPHKDVPSVTGFEAGDSGRRSRRSQVSTFTVLLCAGEVRASKLTATDTHQLNTGAPEGMRKTAERGKAQYSQCPTACSALCAQQLPPADRRGQAFSWVLKRDRPNRSSTNPRCLMQPPDPNTFTDTAVPHTTLQQLREMPECVLPKTIEVSWPGQACRHQWLMPLVAAGAHMHHFLCFFWGGGVSTGG
uniref:Uncharacterized protein n=1 Tax=Eutreptiella gymnastica TaxID=73025 RepID=A0A7S4GF04_9EUGL